jgi:hypothetical protein
MSARVLDTLLPQLRYETPHEQAAQDLPAVATPRTSGFSDGGGQTPR